MVVYEGGWVGWREQGTDVEGIPHSPRFRSLCAILSPRTFRRNEPPIAGADYLTLNHPEGARGCKASFNWGEGKAHWFSKIKEDENGKSGKRNSCD